MWRSQALPVLHGRGTPWNPPNRFERLHVDRYGWTDPEDPPPQTQLLNDATRSILAYNDLTAIGVMMAAREMGVRIPEDISLVGFDDIDVTEFVSPPLTTVHQPREAMGRAAMQMALDILNEQTIQNRILACKLVIRESADAPISVNKASVPTFSPA
jgi:DNA-binding LacI/PurR family transcriptional regulator